jgi:hypothetical protein
MSQQNIITKGSDIELSVFLQIQDCNGIVLPYDLTGKTVSCLYRDAANVLVTKISPDVAVLNAVSGNISITLTDTETDALKVGFLVFDIRVDDGSDRKIWRFEREVTVRDRVR